MDQVLLHVEEHTTHFLQELLAWCAIRLVAVGPQVRHAKGGRVVRAKRRVLARRCRRRAGVSRYRRLIVIRSPDALPDPHYGS